MTWLGWKLVHAAPPSASEPGLTPGGLSDGTLASGVGLTLLPGLGALTTNETTAFSIAGAAGLTAVLALMARRPRRVAVAAARYAPASLRAGIEASATATFGTAAQRGILGAVGFFGLLALSKALGTPAAIVGGAGLLLLFAAVVGELVRSTGAAAVHTALVWSTQKLYEVGPALAFLSEAGILAEPRGLALRRLYPFAFYVPIEIYVTPADRERAVALLATIPAPDTSPPPPALSATMKPGPAEVPDSPWPGPVIGP